MGDTQAMGRVRRAQSGSKAMKRLANHFDLLIATVPSFPMRFTGRLFILTRNALRKIPHTAQSVAPFHISVVDDEINLQD
jgi:hypothetical protein